MTNNVLPHPEDPYISSNPGIVILNYKLFEERMNLIREELMIAVFHPKRFARYLNMGYDIGDETYD